MRLKKGLVGVTLRSTAAIATLAVLIVVMANARDPASSLHAASNTVDMENNFFSPNPIVVNVGDTITWTNNSGAPHTTTDGARGDPQAGGVWDHIVFSGASSPAVTFNTAGEFPYCQ